MLESAVAFIQAYAGWIWIYAILRLQSSHAGN